MSAHTSPAVSSVPVIDIHELRNTELKLHSKTEECKRLRSELEELNEVNSAIGKAQHALQEQVCKVNCVLLKCNYGLRHNCQSGRQGGALVLWRADLYQKEALRQLSDTSFHAKVDRDPASTNQQIVKSTINELIVKQELPATATNLIITTPRTSCIYFLPKIHKPNNPGRPVVSACSCPTELISSYLDKIMAPIIRSLPSYVKDSQHALQIFHEQKVLYWRNR